MQFPRLSVGCLCLLGSLALPALAETWSPITDAEKQRLDARILTLREEAQAGRQEAEDQFLVDQKACWKKVLVSDCIDEAKARRVKAIQAARQKELEANALQREVNNRTLATKEARRREEAPQKAVEQQTGVERYRAEQAKAAAERQKRQQDKQQEAATGRARNAAEAKARADRLNEKQKEAPPRSTATPEEDVAQRVSDRDKRVAEKTAEREKKEKERAAERAAWEAKQKQGK